MDTTTGQNSVNSGHTTHHSSITTEIIKISAQDDDSQFDRPIKLLTSNEVVAFPTETVYGLGANALSGSACLKIFQAKNRPSDNPLIVHISSIQMLNTLVSHISPNAQKLISNFWPGPLTILFPKKQGVVPDEVTTGLNTVAVRMPSHPIAKKLIELSNLPIAAPSANSSGRPSPTTAQHVYDDLKGRIQCIVDGGSTQIGLESTVVDVTNEDSPMILRPGGVTKEQLQKVLPNIKVYVTGHTKELEEKPPTPGLKYRHYSPDAKVVVFTLEKQSSGGGNGRKMSEELNKRIEDEVKNGGKVGVIKTQKKVEVREELKKNELYEEYDIGTMWEKQEERSAEVAKGLFKALR
eukprot:TRINITY_DN27252_c0_g1_i1.p1 TRINITY_DN27252_c0_g1~~TRINITY_DN27252_c0_g1_i1.p1  ORF type:complete len:351 (-),score=98.00 TRINITY_DN27252_c0_g1_i1:239-1291(-)